MKFSRALPFACAFSALSLSLSPTAIAKSKDFTEALQDYYVASQAIQGSMYQSAFMLDKTLTQAPQVDAFQSLGQSFPEKLEAYRESFEAIEKLSKNASVREQFGAVLAKINEDKNQKLLPALEEFSGAVEDFSESLQKETFTVYAQEGWANSGIRVEQGDLIWVESEGAWQASPNYSPVNSDGYLCRSDAYTLNRNAPLGALLYRVRGSSSINGMGLDEGSRGKADASGRLEFIMNDEDRRNNGGQQRLTVIVMNQENLRNVIQSFQEMRELAND